MSASWGFRLLGKIRAGAISQIIMIIYHTLWLLRITLNNNYYYLFKIFPQFWLAKSTCTYNSPEPVTDDQISKNFVFNDEMTLKIQPATG